MRNLEDKRVVITGGAGGVGAATVQRFIEEGSRLFVLDRDKLGLQRIQHELPGLAGRLEADVSDEAAVDRAFAELDDIAGGLDVLVNNAGISIRHKFLDISAEEWRRVLEVNLLEPFSWPSRLPGACRLRVRGV